jgi:hypothetical protein
MQKATSGKKGTKKPKTIKIWSHTITVSMRPGKNGGIGIDITSDQGGGH